MSNPVIWFNGITLTRYVVVSGNLDKPRDVEVDAAAGVLFWTDVGQVPKIERAGLDGSGRRVVTAKGVKSPAGLAVNPTLRSVRFNKVWN